MIEFLKWIWNQLIYSINDEIFDKILKEIENDDEDLYGR